MFTTNQKKLIVALQTSKKAKGKMINKKEPECRCCLGVYAEICGYSYIEEPDALYVDFENDAPDGNNLAFGDYTKHHLRDSVGGFHSLSIVGLDNLTLLNDYNADDFSHKFISKFLFTMPQYVFANFSEPENIITFSVKKFKEYVEKQAINKQYEKIVKSWKCLLE